MALMMCRPNTVILLLYAVMVSQAMGKEACSDPLGMENGNIKNSQITVSSAFRISNSGNSARLNTNLLNWGAWCPNITNAERRNLKYYEYIQIDLLHLTTVRRVATQGRELSGGKEFVKTYQISYSYDNRNWIYYREKSSEVKIFTGNSEESRVVESKIDPPIVARYVRIHPGYTIPMQVCLRLELYGCLNEQGILSYSIPQGHTTKNGKVHYVDTIYNGVAKNGILYNGTGLLTDGEIGPVNAKESMGKGWVGWYQSDHVNITFEFDTLRKFNDVTITVNIDNIRRYLLFKKSKILFGVREDDLSQSSALQYCPKQVNATQKIINFTLPLCGNVGKFVRIQLYPEGRSLLISEIKFNSVKALNTERRSFQTCRNSEDRSFFNKPSLCPSLSPSTSTNSCTDILSYSMPQGRTTGDEQFHYNDTIYNGTARSGILYNGTGLLTDGEIGPVDSKKGKGWVGWNGIFLEQNYVNITFEFCSLQKFKDVSIVININNEHGNSLFNNSRILFSPTADGFSGSSALQYFPKQLQLQTVMVGNVNIKLPLCGNIAKFVRIQLYLGSRWILLSEIKFNSVPALATDPTVFKTCSGISNNVCQLTETSSAHLLYIMIGLVCAFCIIGLVILALLLTRRKVKQPTKNEEVSLEIRAPSSVLNNGNDDGSPEAPVGLTQMPNNEAEEEDEIEEGYEYPSSHPESGYVNIPARTANNAVGYTSLIRPAPEDDHNYQKLLKSSG